jgi:hypothetical protein
MAKQILIWSPEGRKRRRPTMTGEMVLDIVMKHKNLTPEDATKNQ